MRRGGGLEDVGRQHGACRWAAPVAGVRPIAARTTSKPSGASVRPSAVVTVSVSVPSAARRTTDARVRAAITMALNRS